MAADRNDPVHGVRLVVSLYREFEQVARSGRPEHGPVPDAALPPRGSRRAGELAAANAVTKPTVSAMINGLRQQGWVADTVDETGDGRVTRVELTSAGRARLARFEAELADRMEELLPGVDRAEVRRFFGDLQRAHAETRQERLADVFGPAAPKEVGDRSR